MLYETVNFKIFIYIKKQCIADSITPKGKINKFKNV